MADCDNPVPYFADKVSLYFSDGQQRWVLSAPGKLVLLDPLTLDILLACDGERSLNELAGEIDLTLHGGAQNGVSELVNSTVAELVQRGFLKISHRNRYSQQRLLKANAD